MREARSVGFEHVDAVSENEAMKAWKGQGQMREIRRASGSVGIWRASGPLRPYKFSHGRHIISVLGKCPVHSGGVKRDVDALDQGDWNGRAGAL